LKKKIWLIPLALLLIASLVACAAPAPAPAPEQPSLKYGLTFHAGSIGGSWFQIAAILTGGWTELIDGLYITTVPGGGVGNPVEVGKDTTGTHIGISSTPLLKEAVEGSPTYQELGAGEGFKSLSPLANLGEGQICNFVVAADAVPEGVNTFGELLKAEPSVTISVGERGTSGELYTSRILELYGLSYDDVDEWGGRIEFTSYDDAVASIIDGHLDGIWQNSPLKQAKLIELATSRDVVFLPVEEEIAEGMKERYGLIPSVIPAGTYSGQDSDVLGPMEVYVLFGNQSMDDELAYQMTKVVLENKERWVMARPQLRVFEPATAMNVGLELHPGAKRAFEDLGLMK